MHAALLLALLLNSVWLRLLWAFDVDPKQAFKPPMRQSPEALCTLEDQILHLCSSSKSRMIFTAGVPGAGKTFVLHQLRALGNVTVLRYFG